MLESDFNKVAEQPYWNHTSAWVFSYMFAAYFYNTLSWEANVEMIYSKNWTPKVESLIILESPKLDWILD